METLIENLITAMLSGGPQAIIALLVLVIAGLIWDRRRLLDDLARKDGKIDGIIDEYYKGNLTLTEALNSLKMVLAEIKSKW